MTEVESYSKQITASFSDRNDSSFFVFTTFSASDDPKDIENGTMSISITDGLQFWRSKESVTADELSKSSGRGRIRPALEALTDKFSSTQKYTYSIDTRDEGLFLNVFYEIRPDAGLSRLRVQLHPVSDAKAAVASTLTTMMINLDRLQVATHELRRGKSALETEVAALRSLAQEFVGTRKEIEKVERENYCGIAALLNLKKKQLRNAAGRDEVVSNGEEGEEEEKAMEVEEREAMDIEEQKVKGETTGGAPESEEESEEEEEEEDSMRFLRDQSPDRGEDY